MRYISSKSELVDAWQIDAGEIRYQGDYPDWIGDLIRAGRIMHSKYPGQVELYVNSTDKIFVNHGEYIVRDTSNNLSACTAVYFNENYEVWNGDYEYDTGRPMRSAKLTEKNFIVDKIEDHEDGSCTIHFDMDMDTLKYFAGIGVQKVLMDHAKKVIKENDS
jgi:hypothetical protein